MPTAAILVVFAIQLAAVIFEPAEAFARSYLGSFTQGVLATIAFGRVTSLTIRGRLQRKRVSKIYDLLIDRVLNGDSLDCPELSRAFFELNIVEALRNKGWVGGTELDINECGVFVLGYQYYGHDLTIQNFDSSCLTEMADSAARGQRYRVVVILDALRRSVPPSALWDTMTEIEQKGKRLRVGSKFAEADARLERRIHDSTNEYLTMISTTSQVSNFLMNVIRRNSGHLSKVAVCHISPLVLKHEAAIRQLDELRIPQAVIPVGQQLPHSTVDIIRRSLRTMLGVREMWDNLPGSDVVLETLSMKVEHPGLKLRLLRNASYLQIFFGSLRYPGNIYRFGYEIDDVSLVKRLMEYVDNWIEANTESCDNIDDVESLTRHTTSDLARWLLGQPGMLDSIDSHRETLFNLLPEPRAREHLQQTFDLMARGMEVTHTTNSSAYLSQHKIYVPTHPVGPEATVTLDDGTECHVSAGVIIRFRQKVLVVKKVTSPNSGRWSIPAGHCQWGESAHMAARRELMEETGIAASSLRLIYQGVINERLACRHGRTVHVWYLYCLELKVQPDIRLEETELAEYRWMDRSTVARLKRTTAAFGSLLSRVDVYVS